MKIEAPFILGTMRWSSWGAGWTPEEQSEKINTAAELGLRSFDLADIYGEGNGEAEFGRALQYSGIKRTEVQIISKFGIVHTPVKHYNTDFDYIRFAAKRSLERLKTDYLDQFLVHRPDPLMQPEEVAHAFQSLLEEGLVKSVGVSNFLPHQFDLLNKYIPLQTNQIEWNLNHLDPIWNGQLDQMTKGGKQAQVWSPFGGGASTDIAPEAEILAWIKRHPSQPVPIVGSTKPERWKRLLECDKIEMSRPRWFEILEKARGKRIE